MKNKEKIIISTMLCVCVLFFISPALMRISFIHDGISWYFDGLGNSNFKSSYMSSIGGGCWYDNDNNWNLDHTKDVR